MTEPTTNALNLIDCKVCEGDGLVPETDYDGMHLVHCPCTYRRPCGLLCRCSEGPL